MAEMQSAMSTARAAASAADLVDDAGNAIDTATLRSRMRARAREKPKKVDRVALAASRYKQQKRQTERDAAQRNMELRAALYDGKGGGHGELAADASLRSEQSNSFNNEAGLADTGSSIGWEKSVGSVNGGSQVRWLQINDSTRTLYVCMPPLSERNSVVGRILLRVHTMPSAMMLTCVTDVRCISQTYVALACCTHILTCRPHLSHTFASTGDGVTVCSGAGITGAHRSPVVVHRHFR
jgi:hypothetical protein